MHEQRTRRSARPLPRVEATDDERSRHDLRSRYKGTALGFAWNFAIPLLNLAVFYLLFGVLLGQRPRTGSGEQNYAIFLFVGLLPWTFFASSLTAGASAALSAGRRA